MRLMFRYIALITVGLMIFTACGSTVTDDETTVVVEELLETTGSDEVGTRRANVASGSGQIEPKLYERAELLLDNVHSGGVPKDGIPSIDSPEYVAVAEVYEDFDPKAQFFVLELEDEVYLYPQSILVWHEIINLENHELAVTYCPLTGSCITYAYPEGLDTTFGTSGRLINSNLLMYDRHTDAFISQIDGVGLDENLQGYALETVPTFWADWKDVRDVYPDALVLTDNTGFFRDYSRDPYGSYTEDRDLNYYVNDGIIFPLIEQDLQSTFSDKHVVVAVKNNGSMLAIDPQVVKEAGSYAFSLGGDDFIAVYDGSIDTVRVYFHDGSPYDELESLMTLETPTFFEVMWFAWFAFYPDTEVIK